MFWFLFGDLTNRTSYSWFLFFIFKFFNFLLELHSQGFFEESVAGSSKDTCQCKKNKMINLCPGHNSH